jgi:hypothetical protein
MKVNVFIYLLFALPFLSLGQTTKVSGKVWDANTGQPMPYVKVQFKNTKTGTLTDSVGGYSIETYYASDSILFSFNGYLTMSNHINVGKEQEVNVRMATQLKEINEVVIRPPDELPSVRLHKKVIANKDINNKEKLSSYEYELYNKFQMDINNIDDDFGDGFIVKRLDLVMGYLDSTSSKKTYLPALLTESISNFYYKNKPRQKKEVLQASRITGVENLQLDQFLGDMYFDINVYDNSINILNRSFISPVSNFARNHYRFYLDDSTFIDNQWCYKMRFVPKRSGEMTFTGEMWIHDTTYAVKQFSATIAADANINYISSLYFEHEFKQVEKEIWMLTKEKLIVDINVTKKSKIYGFYGRKTSTRKNFVINKDREPDFYNAESTVEFVDSARTRSSEYWETHRHIPLNIQEVGISEMVDTLKKMPFFKTLSNTLYMATTGYYPLKYIQIGDAYSLISNNPVEGLRTGLALRTSRTLSKRFELGGTIAYGFGDKRFKHGESIRYNITPKKRGMLTAYYNYDIEQIGQAPSATAVGATFATLFRTGPMDKLTFVQRTGISLEKDFKKDMVLFGGFDWKEFTAMGNANYIKYNDNANTFDTISSVVSSEFIARIRWTKDEEFLGGAFDRVSLRSKYPIFSIQGIFGVKGLFGSDYNYQKIEFQMEHKRPIGYLGSIRYGLNAGYVFGSAAYPFLKVHEGNQSYWFSLHTFNKLNFYEFVSDKYVGGFIENHWQGLLFDRIPLIKKLKFRLVTSGRITYGGISDRHKREMLLPAGTRSFGKIPYAEATVGIENILQVLRVDLVWRITHLDPGVHPLGIRVRWSFIL